MLEDNSPWWRQYRRQKYKPPVKLNIEMILRKSIKDTFTEYLENVSLYTIRWVTETPLLIFSKVLRVGIFLSLVAWALYFIHYVVVDIVGNPLIVSIENDAYPSSELDFPAVAICNINRISKKAALTYAEKVIIPKLEEPYNSIVQPEFLLDIIAENGRLIDFTLNPLVEYIRKGTLFAEQIAETDPNEIADIMAQLSPKCDDLLLACMWGRRLVDCKEIFSVRRTILGHCCVFNYESDFSLAFQRPNATVSNIKRQAVPGDLNGLLLVIDVQSDDYVYPLYSMDGVEVFLFDPTHFPESNGGGRVIRGMVQPGEIGVFSLQSVKQYATNEVRKQSLQSRKCLFKDERPDEYGNMYSYSTCLMKCRLKAIQSLCKCNPYFYPVSVADGPICTPNDLPCLAQYRDCEFTKHRMMMTKLPWDVTNETKHFYAEGFVYHRRRT